MKRVVRTRREVRFTVTTASKKKSAGEMSSSTLSTKCLLTLEEVGGVDDGEDEDGGEVDGEDGVQQPPLEHQRHLQAGVGVACIVVGERPETKVRVRV